MDSNLALVAIKLDTNPKFTDGLETDFDIFWPSRECPEEASKFFQFSKEKFLECLKCFNTFNFNFSFIVFWYLYTKMILYFNKNHICRHYFELAKIIPPIASGFFIPWFTSEI